MSWLTDIAGKAETLLNQIDQNAASVLNEPHHPNSKTSNVDNQPALTEVVTSVDPPQPQYLDQRGTVQGSGQISGVSGSLNHHRKQPDRDEELMQVYLDS